MALAYRSRVWEAIEAKLLAPFSLQTLRHMGSSGDIHVFTPQMILFHVRSGQYLTSIVSYSWPSRSQGAFAHPAHVQTYTLRNALLRALGKAEGPLERRNVEDPPVIGLHLETSFAYVVSVLACLSLGCAFMPLDPTCPPGRLRNALARHRVRAVLWAAEECLGGLGRLPIETDAAEVTSAPQSLQVALDWDLPHALCQSAATEACDGSDGTLPADLSTRREALPFMYILNTSGSTGSPVSVHGTEEGLLRLAEWIARSSAWPEALPSDCWALRTRPAAVDSVWECLGVLLCGQSGAILLDSRLQTRAEAAGAMLVDAHALGVTHMSATPAEWRAALGGAAPVPDRSLRVAVSSGEALSARLAARLAGNALAPRADSRVVNLYGCTEAAGDSTWCFLSRELALAGKISGSIPAGRPVDYAGVAVAQLADEADLAEPRFDSQGRVKLLPRGERGAVLLFGKGLACPDVPGSPLAVVYAGAEEVKRHGIVGSQVLHDEQHDEVQCVCPGDLGYLTDRGELVVCGRLAHAPPKLGGVRVDLEEVRAALEELSGVEQAAAKVWTTPTGRPLLAAYVATGGHGDIEPSADGSTINAWTAWARKQLTEMLPGQAVPRIIVRLPALPLTPGGKVDFARLPEPGLAAKSSASEHVDHGPAGLKRSRQSHVQPEVPASPPSLSLSEAAVAAAVWRRIGRLEPCDDFYAAGADSLDLAALAADLHLRPQVVFSHSSIRALASATRPAVGELREAAAHSRAVVRAARSATACTNLSVSWTTSVAGCVDAPLLLLSLQGRQSVVACSHSGTVARIDLQGGKEIWRRQFPQRLDIGAALLHLSAACKAATVLLVGSLEGQVHVLCPETGASLQDPVDVGCPPRGRLVAEALLADAVWMATHASALVVFFLDETGRVCFVQHPLPAPASAVSRPLRWQGRSVAVVACLDGTLHVLSCSLIRESEATCEHAGLSSGLLAASSASAGASVETIAAIPRSINGPVPMFARPMCVEDGNGAQLLVGANVHGSAWALRILLQDGSAAGVARSPLWRRSFQCGQVFTTPCLVRIQPRLARRTPAVEALVIGTSQGVLWFLEVRSGIPLCRPVSLAPGTPAPVTGLELWALDSAGRVGEAHLLVTLGDGQVCLVSLSGSAGLHLDDAIDQLETLSDSSVLAKPLVVVRVEYQARLPAGCFSGAVSHKTAIVAGCRDDRVYAFHLPS